MVGGDGGAGVCTSGSPRKQPSTFPSATPSGVGQSMASSTKKRAVDKRFVLSRVQG